MPYENGSLNGLSLTLDNTKSTVDGSPPAVVQDPFATRFEEFCEMLWVHPEKVVEFREFTRSEEHLRDAEFVVVFSHSDGMEQRLQ